MSTILTQNLQLQNIVTGTQPTTWWNTENFDRTLVDQAIAGVSKFDITSGNLTLTIQGSTPPASSRVWVFTGTPTATATVSFGPNTCQNLVLAVNRTAQSIVFSQSVGGAQVTLSTNLSAIITFDGTGAGANCTQFVFNPPVGPGTVTNPSYSFTGYTDLGLYVPGAHTMAVAANGVEMASFQQFGTTGPYNNGLNVWGKYQ